MKKSERLNQELIYLSDKKVFHLKELEQKFFISERTALRDIADLERLGLAFYSKGGRHGGYYLTNNKLLLPIRFNTQEINAIFFALNAIREINTTPYSNDYDEIELKLLKSLPQNLQKQVKLQEKMVHFYSQPSLNKVNFFKELVVACINNYIIKAKNYQFIRETQKLQILDLFFQAGNWFCHAYNLDIKKWYILRLDKFKDIQFEVNQTEVMTKKELAADYIKYQKNYYRVKYSCLLTKSGEQKVRYNFYPAMKIIHKNKKIYLEGMYNPEELHYLVDYLISLGGDVQVIEPEVLKNRYVAKLKKIISKY